MVGAGALSAVIPVIFYLMDNNVILNVHRMQDSKVYHHLVLMGDYHQIVFIVFILIMYVVLASIYNHQKMVVLFLRMKMLVIMIAQLILKEGILNILQGLK